MSTEVEKPSAPEPNSNESSRRVSRPATEGALRILPALKKKRAETLPESTSKPRSGALSTKDEARKLYQQLKVNREKSLAQHTPSPASPPDSIPHR
jgi:hypothetical protein